MRFFPLALVAAAGVAVSGCAYDGFGLGAGYGSPYGYGYSPYGSYGSYGSYGGYSPYYGSGYGYGYGSYDPYYGGYGYGSPYGYGSGYGGLGYGYGSGWYGGYFYPGTGYYVYDRKHHRRQMTDAERAYWKQRVASGVADQIRRHRGESVTTRTTTPITTQQVMRSRSIRSTATVGDGGGESFGDRRARIREEAQSRREERRTAREIRSRRDQD